MIPLTNKSLDRRPTFPLEEDSENTVHRTLDASREPAYRPSRSALPSPMAAEINVMGWTSSEARPSHRPCCLLQTKAHLRAIAAVSPSSPVLAHPSHVIANDPWLATFTPTNSYFPSRTEPFSAPLSTTKRLELGNDLNGQHRVRLPECAHRGITTPPPVQWKGGLFGPQRRTRVCISL